MPQTYFYINSPDENRISERELILLDKAGYTVVMNRTALDNAPPYVAAANRPQLSSMLRRIAPGDVLVVHELSSLGCSARDVLATLMQCRKAKISVRCVEIGKTDLTSRPEPAAVKTLRAVIRLEMAARSLRSRSSLECARENGRRTGRPPSLAQHLRERVVQSLNKGMTVSEVARKFDTSRQTILRIRASVANQRDS